MGGGKFLVQSVPGELSMDDTKVLQLAEESNGHVSVELCIDALRWDRERAERILDRLVKLERAWVDKQVSYVIYKSIFMLISRLATLFITGFHHYFLNNTINYLVLAVFLEVLISISISILRRAFSTIFLVNFMLAVFIFTR